MDKIKERYAHASMAVDAGAALNLLEVAACTLEAMPFVDNRLQRLESQMAARLRKEQRRMLKVMDAAHAKAGTPRPY